MKQVKNKEISIFFIIQMIEFYVRNRQKNKLLESGSINLKINISGKIQNYETTTFIYYCYRLNLKFH